MNAGDKSHNKMDIFGKNTAYRNDKYETFILINFYME